jgi:hypothetical protein
MTRSATTHDPLLAMRGVVKSFAGCAEKVPRLLTVSITAIRPDNAKQMMGTKRIHHQSVSTAGAA